MNSIKDNKVWIFNGSNSKFCSGVFSSRENAEAWIHKNKLSGLLTLYPLDQGVYDWAVTNDYFVPKKELETTSEFIQRFTSASQEHFHYENGELD